MYKIGIDIGGTQIRLGLVLEQKVIEVKNYKTDKNSYEKSFEEILKNIEEWKKSKEITGLGISCPGPLDLINGIILDPANLIGTWHNFKIVEYFKKKTNLEIKLNNDANIQGLYHAKYGKGKDYKIVQFFTFSTGLGAGFVINKEIFVGEQGFAQEIANIPLGLPSFGVNGLINESVESVASGTGITMYAQSLGLKVNEAREVFDLAANKKDQLAIKVLEQAKHSLAKTFATAIGMLNPGCIVVDGSVATKNISFMKEVFQECEKMLFPSIQNKTKYYISEAEGMSGVIGAANLF